MVDGNGLENRRGATYREFESRPLRHTMRPRRGRIVWRRGAWSSSRAMRQQRDRVFGVAKRYSGKACFCQNE